MYMRLFILSALAGLTACTTTAPLPAFDPDLSPVEAVIVGGEGQEIGVAVLNQGPNGVLGSLTLMPGAVSPGWHGLHIHQVGDCSDAGKFTLSGGHLGKIEGGHGLLNLAGPEMGDLPNLYAAEDGSAGMEFFSDLFSLHDLRDSDFAALIIHAGRDDHITQPIGGAGARVGCAVLK
ncbi:MAG: superoxide dismutase family protein [Hyphomonadaceae bacterium]|nr:superoxide dismutase family protein [Hyphomonadaceae bacterium]